jgi:hypothetical protein
MCQNGHNAVRKAFGNLGGKWEMGQESEGWIVSCAQKMRRRGGAGKGSGSKGCSGAEHGQACSKERTGAVAVRAALESAVQVGRGDEGNRQAEMANTSKCRDSLRAVLPGQARCNVVAMSFEYLQSSSLSKVRKELIKWGCIFKDIDKE